MPQLIDGFGREINALRLSVTDLCNERCIYCMPPEGVHKRKHGDILTLEELFDIAKAAVELGVSKVRLTGGEPLVRRGVMKLIRRLGALNGLRELCVTTNGLLLADMADELKAAGVSRVNISLDTLRPDRYVAITRTGEINAAFKGIELALARFQKVKLNVVLMGGINDDEIGDFIALTRRQPLEVRFLELMPMGECAGWASERFINVGEVLRRFPTLKPIGRSGVAELYRAEGYAGTVGLIRPLSECFCGECSRIRVTADGMLKPCLHSSLELPLRGLCGDALKSAITKGVSLKPASHMIRTHGSDAQRRMNEIGG